MLVISPRLFPRLRAMKYCINHASWDRTRFFRTRRGRGRENEVKKRAFREKLALDTPRAHKQHEERPLAHIQTRHGLVDLVRVCCKIPSSTFVTFTLIDIHVAWAQTWSFSRLRESGKQKPTSETCFSSKTNSSSVLVVQSKLTATS